MDEDELMSDSDVESQPGSPASLPEVPVESEVERLERSVQAAQNFLEALKAKIEERAQSPDARRWIQEIGTLMGKFERKKTVIGVVGNTGAGKSSVINAVLDEVSLMPTSATQACTAVPVAISYNRENDSPYYAEVHFITREEWKRELQSLRRDLCDEEGNLLTRVPDPKSDAGIAYAKINAVFPGRSIEDIALRDIDELIGEISYSLNRIHKVQEKTANALHTVLRQYVASNPSSSRKKLDDTFADTKPMAFWPLVREVRIWLKTPVLANGAILVDLPGVRDANSARGKVAARYLRNCNKIWIASHINRAIDDETAQTLLSDSFKRQLGMDGSLGSLTFICTKSDDLDMDEIQNSVPGAGEALTKLDDEQKLLLAKQVTLDNQSQRLDSRTRLLELCVVEWTYQISILKRMQDSAEANHVPASSKASLKRHKRFNDFKMRKRPRLASSGSLSAIVSKKPDYQLEEDVEIPVPFQLGSNSPEIRLVELETKLAQVENKLVLCKTQRKSLAQEGEETQAALDTAHSSKMNTCITARNNFLKQGIQEQYCAEVHGFKMRHHDDTTALEAGQMQSDVEILSGLDVFCVSSRAYQELKKPKHSRNTAGFHSCEQTEIPRLQAHCLISTELARCSTCRVFLDDVDQLLNSIRLHASTDEVYMEICKRESFDACRTEALLQLKIAFEDASKTGQRSFRNLIESEVYVAIDAAIAMATSAAPGKGRTWRTSACATYKAICRHGGSYVNRAGQHDWNEDLQGLLLESVSSVWAEVFTMKVPNVAKDLSQAQVNGFRIFNKAILNALGETASTSRLSATLVQQGKLYEEKLSRLASTINAKVRELSKDANRQFLPPLLEKMEHVYEACANDSGPGTFKRMKDMMDAHLKSNSQMMYKASGNNVKAGLESITKTIEIEMEKMTSEIYQRVASDYSVFIQQDTDFKPQMTISEQEKKWRNGISKLLDSEEARMHRLHEKVNLREEAPVEGNVDLEKADI